MPGVRVERRLAAIMATDVVAYSRLVETDEARTLNAIKALRSEVVDPVIADHRGRIVKLMGDGAIVEFVSAVDAVACAVAMQEGTAAHQREVPPGSRIVFRIGINVGDVVVEDGDLLGDGVNIAARLEALAEPGSICISDAAQKQLAGKTDLAFEDAGERTLKNIAQPVRIWRWSKAPTTASASGAPERGTFGGKPSLLVLPFQNLGDDPAQKYISTGFTQDVTTELSRFSGFAVAAPQLASHISRNGTDPLTGARALGISYIVEGSLRKAGQRLRVSVQSTSTVSGLNIWSERYDSSVSEIFEMQDKIVAAIVATIDGQVTASEADSARKKPTESWSAYDFLLQGREICNANREPEAVPYFRRAIAADPGFAQAYAWLALALSITMSLEPDSAHLDEAEHAAQTALNLHGNDSTSHWARAMLSLLSRDHVRAGFHFDRAIALNPADAQIRCDRANWLRLSGRFSEGLEAVEQVIAMAPLAPHWFAAIRGRLLFDLRRYDEAIRDLQGLPHATHMDLSFLAAAHAHLGKTETAGKIFGRINQLRPELTILKLASCFSYAASSDLEHLLEGLRAAAAARLST